MDAGRFDSLAKTLVTNSTRRTALRRLAGGLGGPLATAATALIGLAPDLAAAKDKKNKKNKTKKQKSKCTSDEVKCGGKCIAKNDCCVEGKRIKNSELYRQCAYCLDGKLYTNPGTCSIFDPEGCTVCNEQTSNCEPGNEHHTCGLSSGFCGVCRSGLCEPDGRKLCSGNCCAKGEDCCGGLCVDLQTNVNNCGRCGFNCAGSCSGGQCHCPDGYHVVHWQPDLDVCCPNTYFDCPPGHPSACCPSVPGASCCAAGCCAP